MLNLVEDSNNYRNSDFIFFFLSMLENSPKLKSLSIEFNS